MKHFFLAPRETKLNLLALILTLLFFNSECIGQENSFYEVKGDTIIYSLTISENKVNFTGEEITAMTVNGSIPAPTLHFQEGKFAVIYVINKMDVETSVHWHGILLPNFQDGVPYLNTPPILPNQKFKYEFFLKHSGTFWYHSHTGLQEQRGVYGAIVIEPKKKKIVYDKELAVVLSDWTDENPEEVLRTLKRHNEWYGIKRGTQQPFIPSVMKGMLSERLILYRERMPDMHISDIYYDSFLANGKPEVYYGQFKPGEKVRIRLINAAASTYFWINSGVELEVISADGVDVVPIKTKKILMAIAETYDFLITVPEDGQLEIRASAQDGSGKTSFFIGNGNKLLAPDIPKQDYFELMKKVAVLHSSGGHSGHLNEPYVKLIPAANHSENHNKSHGEEDKSKHQIMDHSGHGMTEEPNVTSNFNYDFLRSPEKTALSHMHPTREIQMNLDADMLRYVWTINGKVLSEEDKIHIKKGENVRFILNNNTMMHHPMHLHGHFFRVVNKNGEYSPLKHTFDIPPFESATIEFEANEMGDWFFHCHVLYHMKAGMARVVSYGTPRDSRLKNFSYSNLLNADQHWYKWGDAKAGSHMAELQLMGTNTRNAIKGMAEYGWNKNFEAEVSYERYVSRYLRLFAGVNSENENKDNLDEIETIAIAGVRYKLLSILDTEFQLDNKIRPELTLDWHVLLFSRLIFFGEYEAQFNLGITESLPGDKKVESKITSSVGLEYIITKNFSFFASYDNRFGAGAGVNLRL